MQKAALQKLSFALTISLLHLRRGEQKQTRRSCCSCSAYWSGGILLVVLVQGGCLITYPSSELGGLFVGAMMGKRGTLTDREAFLVSTQGRD